MLQVADALADGRPARFADQTGFIPLRIIGEQLNLGALAFPRILRN